MNEADVRPSSSLRQKGAAVQPATTNPDAGSFQALLLPNPNSNIFGPPVAVGPMPRAATARDPSRRLSYVSCCGTTLGDKHSEADYTPPASPFASTS